MAAYCRRCATVQLPQLAMLCAYSMAVLLAVAVTGEVAPSSGLYRSRARCERITVPLCLDMKYNMTRMPNLVGHTSQAEAAMQVHEFVPLIQFGCSRLLKFFLCSLYAPMCTVQVDEPMVIPACRSMCLEVRDKCEPILQRFSFSWPPALDCSTLPERSDPGSLCIDLPPPTPTGGTDDPDPDAEYRPADAGRGRTSGGPVDQNPDWTELLGVFQSEMGYAPATATNRPGLLPVPSRETAGVRHGRTTAAPRPSRRCPDRFVPTLAATAAAATSTMRPSTAAATAITSTSGTNASGFDDELGAACAARCGVDVMFRAADKRFVTTWMTVWATVGLASSLFAALTFVVDPSRFDYPERPVICIAVCYAFYSAAFVVRAAVGPETVSCDRPRFGDGGTSAETDRYVIREGLESVWCMSVFIVVYYFGMAAAVWWTLLAVTWFLASARKWSRESIGSYGGYVHLVGWSVPAVQTIVVLAIRRVDGDELTGMCYVGSQDGGALAGFVIAPLAVYLAVGTALIGLGFLALFGVRHDLKRTAAATADLQLFRGGPSGGPPSAVMAGLPAVLAAAKSSTDVRKLEKLMARIGLFGVVYVVASCCHLAALFYQQVRVDESLRAAMATPCRSTTTLLGDMDSVRQSCALDQSLQSVAMHALKICSPLAIGVASGLWLVSSKTIRSWSAFVGRCCCCCRRRPIHDGGGLASSRSSTAKGRGGARYAMPAGGATGRVARVHQGPGVGDGRPTLNGGRSATLVGRHSKASSYAALNKGGALSLTTII